MFDPRRASCHAVLGSLLLALGVGLGACSAPGGASPAGQGPEESKGVPAPAGGAPVGPVGAPGTEPVAPIAPGTTVVSITFDDGSASQYATAALLQARGMFGTYYVNSALVGSSRYYMTWPQVHALAVAGNEIGGHTLHHENLTKVDLATARTEVCDDRANLLKEEFPATSFAYPEAGADSPAVEQIVQECGYTTGRGVGSLYGSDCPCPYAETIPPRDPYRLRTAEGVTSATTLADLEQGVVNAESHGGGWVPIAFHGICDDNCTRATSMSTAVFTQFLDWLALRRSNGTVVRTVGQVMQASSAASPR